MEIEPAVGCSKPAISLRQVVLPEPDGPSMAKNSPGAISRSTVSTARTLPKWRETCLKETAKVMGLSVQLLLVELRRVRATSYLPLADRSRRSRGWGWSGTN